MSGPGHRPAAFLLLAFVGLATFYNVATPIFEAPDELWHFQFIRHLAEGRGLPVLQEDPEQNVAGQEGGQPPLYHLLEALAVSWIDATDLPYVSVPSPLLQRIGDGPNIVMHSAREDFPYRGATLAVHVARFFSTLIGAGTVLLTYLLGLEVFGGRKRLALAAAAVTGFIPEFLFLSAAINNDNLIILLSALAIWLSVRALKHGLGTGGAVALGLALAAAPLTKVSGVALAPLAVAALGLRAWQGRSISSLRPVLFIAPMVAATAGWWFLRNLGLYGDLLGVQVFVRAAGSSMQPLTPERLWAEAQGIWVSTWALFGWSNIGADFAVYGLYGVLCLAGAAGLVRAWTRASASERPLSAPTLVVLGLWILVFLALVAQYMRMINGMQGRLFFPALPAIAVLLVAGISELAPRRWEGRWTAALGAVLLAPALLAPVLYIMPAYSRVGLLDEQQIEAIPHRLNVTYGHSMQLLGYRLDDPRVVPGRPLAITLYWRALLKPARDYSVFVHALDARGKMLGGFDGPLGGSYRTTAWRAGVALEETYLLDVAEPEQAPASIRIEAGLYALPSAAGLPAFDRLGDPIGAEVPVATAKVAGPAPGPPPVRQPVALADGLTLEGFDVPVVSLRPGQTLDGRLWWKAQTPPQGDYTVFVQLIGPSGILAQYDARPRAGYYPTSNWDAGEEVEDFFRLAVPPEAPPGAYRLIAGMYDAGTGRRLAGPRGDHVVLGELVLRN